jgi:uncharacterized membrane protein YphA (DoxX/SURF4 family)
MLKRFFSARPLLADKGISIIRILTGLLLTYHGWEVFDEEKMKEYLTWDQFKNSSAAFMVYMGKITELTGGILLTLGLFTRIGSLITAATMLYISLFVGNGRIWYEDQHPFLFVLLAMVFFFTGAGKWSLDKLMFEQDRNLKINNHK